MIDLRSDTVTRPTPEMRRAMAQAKVGDDVYGEDPTVNRLQERAADLLGMEAGLFVASGTMGNLVSLLTHCGRGEEFILGELAHIFVYEAGGAAGLGGIHPRTVPNQPDGTLDLRDVEGAIRATDVHLPRTRLVCLENSHNLCRGAALTPEYTSSLCELAHRQGLAVHLDGARIFNAAIALGVDVKRLTKDVDSVTFCLSKGLGAPVGSVLCGRSEFITEALRARKVVGGGMRQVGVLAAAGLYGLEHHIERLAEDHQKARLLAAGLEEFPQVELQPVQTNILFLRLNTMRAGEFAQQMSAKGVLVDIKGPKLVRLVTHLDVSCEGIAKAAGAIREVLREGSKLHAS